MPTLLSLPATVVGDLWPGQRLVVGLQVCHWLLEHLLKNTRQVVLELAQGADNVDKDSVVKALTRFQQQDISIVWAKPLRSRDRVCKVFFSSISMLVCRTDIRLVRLAISDIKTTFMPGLVPILAHCRYLTDLQLSHNQQDDVGDLTNGLRHCSKLLSLDIANNGIHQSCHHVLDALAHCTALERLNLACNALGGSWDQKNTDQWAPALRHFPHLTSLDLTGNYLRDDEFADIARALAQHCTKLKNLNLSNNNLTDFRGPPGRSLPLLLDNCTALEYLSLSSCGQTSPTSRTEVPMSHPAVLRSLADSLQQCRRLVHLRINAPSCFYTDNGLPIDFLQTLAACTCLTHLHLACFDFSAAPTARPLAAAVGAMHSLKHLSMPKNKFGQRHVKAVVWRLKFCRWLQHLDLSSSILGVNGVLRVVRAAQHWPRLQHLNLSGCFPTGAQPHPLLGAADSVEVPLAIRGRWGQLRELRLAGTNTNSASLDAGGVALLASACPRLERLELQRCVFASDPGSRGGSEAPLAQGLRQCAALTHLNLCGVAFGGEDSMQELAAVVSALGACPRLSVLDLSGLECRAQVRLLEAPLEGLSSLTHLNLSWNFTGRAGADMVLGLLSRGALPRLRFLDMFANDILYKRARELARAAWASGTVVELRMNVLKEEQADAICRRWGARMNIQVQAAGGFPSEGTSNDEEEAKAKKEEEEEEEEEAR